MIRKALLVMCCVIFVAGVISAVSSYVQISAFVLPGGRTSVGWQRGTLVVYRFESPITTQDAIYITDLNFFMFPQTLPILELSIRIPYALPGITVLALAGGAFLARPLLLARRARHRRRRGLCLTCDYDLTGNESGVCPECGTPTEPAP